MNREIKFKAWLWKHLKVVDVIRIDFEAQEITYQEIDFEYEDVIREKTALFKDISLLEYTGLKDKNDVKIFEGDIVKHVKGNTYKVEFYNGGFKLLRFSVYEGKPVAYHDFEVRRMVEMEVIGNIYENPELLEVS